MSLRARRLRIERESEKIHTKVSAFRGPRSQQEATENKTITVTDGHGFGTKLTQNRKIAARDGRVAVAFGETTGKDPR